MNTMSENLHPELQNTGKAVNDSIYNPNEAAHDDLDFDFQDKKSQQISRMVEAVVILCVTAVIGFVMYKVVTGFLG